MGKHTDFVYDPVNDGQLKQIFYPANNPSGDVNSYATNCYDTLGRVETQTNANGKTYNYYYSYYRTKELEPGGLTSSNSFFDEYGNTVASEDQLGNVTSYEIDGQYRRTAVIYPKGNAVLYSYDNHHNNTLIAQIPQTPTDSCSGLVGYWNFDEGKDEIAHDSSPVGTNDGTIYGADWVRGKLGKALKFNGTSDYVYIDTSSNPPDITSNFTISLWVKPLSEHEIDEENLGGGAGTGGQKYVFGPAYVDVYGDGSTAGVGISVGTNGVSVYEHSAGYLPPLLVWQGIVGSSEFTHVAVVYSNNRPSLISDNYSYRPATIRISGY